MTIAAVVAIGCGGPEEPGVNHNQHDEDVGVEEDVGVGSDADAEDDADAQEEPPTPDPGVDEGLDGPFDNCPGISNPDQADRSRDGIGNACDNFPYFYDPSNPESVEVIHEDDGGPNDGWWDAIENWQMEPPFAVEGTISEPGMLDWYMVTVDEPTTLLVHLEAQSNSIWPGLIVMGDDFSTQNRRFTSNILGATDGQSEVRDLHLPLPGDYMMVVSDVRNLMSQGAPTGGPDYEYGLYVSTPPLPEGEPMTLPSTQQVVPYDEGQVQVFSVDTQGVDALQVEATGAPRNQASALLPSIQVKDGRTGEMLGFTISDQVDVDSLHNRLTVKLGDEVGRADVLVEAHQSLGHNDIVVNIEAIDKPEHAESPQAPRHSREDRLLWVRPASWIDSMIGPPVAVADDALDPDIDLFSFYPNPGDFFRVEARPHTDSLLRPEVDLGYLSGADTFFSRMEGNTADEAGEISSFSMLATDDNVMDAILQVAHVDNYGTTIPVGGPAYSYELNIESLDPREEAEEVGGDFPASVPVVLQAGQQGLYDFDFETGFEYTANFDGGFGRELQLIDLHTGQLVDSTRGSMTFRATPDRDLMLAVRDERRNRIDADDDLEIEVQEVAAADSVALGDEVDDELAEAEQARYYSFSAAGGQFVEVRVDAADLELELLGDPNVTTVVYEEEHNVAWARVGADTELVARLERDTENDVDYSARFTATEAGNVDAPEVAQQDLEDGHSGWWRVDVGDMRNLAINTVSDSGQDGPARFTVHERENLDQVDEGIGFGIVDVRDRDVLYVAIHPAGEDGEPTGSVEVAFSQVAPYPYADNLEEVEFVDGIHPVVVADDTDEGGLVNVDIDADDDRFHVELTDVMYRGAGDAVGTVNQRQGDSAVAHGPARHRAVVIPRTGSGDTEAIELDYNRLTVEDAEPVDGEGSPVQIEEWPQASRVAIGGDESARAFVAGLEEGDTVWAVAIPVAESLDEVDPVITAVAPDGQPVETGDDTAVIDELTVDTGGEWTFDVDSAASGSHDVAVFLMRR